MSRSPLSSSLDLDVGIPRDPERVLPEDLHPWEECGHVGLDHLLEWDESLQVGKHDESGQDRRNLDPSKPRQAFVSGCLTTTAMLSERFDM